MSFKKTLVVLSIITAGTFGVYSCKKVNSNPQPVQEVRQAGVERREEKVETLGDVLKYIDDNPRQQELIVDYIIGIREKNELPFSGETIDKLAGIVQQEATTCPVQMKNFVLDISAIGLKSDYRNEIWQQLTAEEKWQLVRDASEYKARECWEETKEIAEDAYEKFRETRLHDKMEDAGERIRRGGREVYRKLRGKEDGNQ